MSWFCLGFLADNTVTRKSRRQMRKLHLNITFHYCSKFNKKFVLIREMLSNVIRDEVNGQITLNRTEKSRFSYLPRPVRTPTLEQKYVQLPKPKYQSQEQYSERRPASASSIRRVSNISPSDHIPGTIVSSKVFSSSLDVSHIRSRICSFDNILHQPHNSNLKIFSKTPSYSHVQTKIPSPVIPVDKLEKPITIFNQKADYSHVTPLVSYRDNEAYTSSGGNVTIQTQKLNFRETAKPKIDSKSNYKSEIPEVASLRIIPKYRMNFKELATTRIDSRRDLKLKETPRSTRHLIDLLTVSLPDLRQDKEPDHFNILSTTPPHDFSIESQQSTPLDNEA